VISGYAAKLPNCYGLSTGRAVWPVPHRMIVAGAYRIGRSGRTSLLIIYSSRKLNLLFTFARATSEITMLSCNNSRTVLSRLPASDESLVL